MKHATRIILVLAMVMAVVPLAAGQAAADKVFIKAPVDIADSLGIKTIAEFVENAEIVRVLQELGAHMGQGNYLGEPQAELLESSELLRYQAR